jgi:hypothetical protein
MRCWQAAVGASATVLALVMGQTLVPEPPEPRSGESLGVALSHTLLELSFANNALKLLNGKESRKLRRLVEWKFASSLASARRQIEEGAVVERAALPSLVPNLVGHDPEGTGVCLRAPPDCVREDGSP